MNGLNARRRCISRRTCVLLHVHRANFLRCAGPARVLYMWRVLTDPVPARAQIPAPTPATGAVRPCTCAGHARLPPSSSAAHRAEVGSGGAALRESDVEGGRRGAGDAMWRRPTGSDGRGARPVSLWFRPFGRLALRHWARGLCVRRAAGNCAGRCVCMRAAGSCPAASWAGTTHMGGEGSAVSEDGGSSRA